ncbi:hypothetical protein [Roseibacillus ishigakijimensis]|uniref:Uncharacterized protein n=1 Tax=Roseibacillus ishigakijimensis TaxID=454146 RepID=A0A934RTZ1_9BACT|nr:hypothetical protein [Roseibacillus ishigakijimensis]MBK1834120.1 hypothetical protein [Roseibacillus ishigakijimensis]
MPRFLLFLLAQLIVLASATAQYQLYSSPADPKHGSKMTVTAMSSILPTSGYLPVRVEIRNGDPQNDRNWSFHFTSKDHSWDAGNHLSSTFSASCPAGKQRSVEFLVPMVTVLQEEGRLSLELRITGAPPIAANHLSMENDHSADWPAILMSQALHTPNSGALNATVASRFSYGGPQFAGSFLPRDLSSDWRAYEGFDLLMLTDLDWKELSPGAQTAIKTWNRLGGKILFYTTDASVSLASLGFEPTTQDGLTSERSWGESRLISLPAATGYSLDASETERLAAGLPNPSNTFVSLRQFPRGWPLQQTFGQRSFNPLLFILILIAFAIVVGPINLFVFAKSGQRQRLFFTTPLISLSASLLLLIIIIFQDGFGGKGHRLAVVELRPEENMAYLHQQQISRTGVLLNTSFEVPDSAIVKPLALEESRWTRVTDYNFGGESRYRMDHEDQSTLRLSGDWFKSRSEYGHQVKAVQPTRGRLELLTTEGRPQVTSTFSFSLKKIYYHGENGVYWQSPGSLASGRSIALEPCPEEDFRRWLLQQKKKFTSHTRNRWEILSGQERRGHFYALADEGPFVDTLPSLNWEESTALLTGPMVKP